LGKQVSDTGRYFVEEGLLSFAESGFGKELKVLFVTF